MIKFVFQSKDSKFVANDEKLHLYSEPGQEDLRCPFFFANNAKNEVEDGMENVRKFVLIHQKNGTKITFLLF